MFAVVFAWSIGGFAAPAAADADWAAVVGGGADAQMAKRLEAEVRTIPGTDTKYLVGGFVQLDGRATRVDGVTATNARLQLSVRYLVR